MLKKLQSLLFEDEEIDDEEEEEEVEVEEEEEEIEEKPARRKRGRKREREAEEEIYEEPVQKPVYQAPAAAPAPAPMPAAVPTPAPVQKPVLKRVEVTQAISVPKPAPAPAPAPAQNTSFNNNAAFQKPSASVQHASPRPIYENRPEQQAPAFRTPAPQVSSFGISADGGSSRPASVFSSPAEKPQPKKNAGVYEFRPVISPMFGVDEKDINAISYVAKNEPQPEPDSHLASQVLSPIYGVDQEPEPAAPQTESPEIPVFNGAAYQPKPQPVENTFPEFSLDDILSARDEEFTRQNVFNNNQEYRTPDIDETAVIDSNQYSPYDQQSLDFNRNR